METIELLRETSARMDRLMRACQKVNEGIAELCAEIAGQKLEAIATTPPPGRSLAVLTPRQREIFGLISKGMPPAEIAKQLKLSQRTVEAHRDTIRVRLNFATVHDLNNFAKAATT